MTEKLVARKITIVLTPSEWDRIEASWLGQGAGIEANIQRMVSQSAVVIRGGADLLSGNLSEGLIQQLGKLAARVTIRLDNPKLIKAARIAEAVLGAVSKDDPK